MSGEPWAPGVSDVARHVPTRTHDATKPGDDTLIMTFNANTTPTDSVVQQMIDDTVAGLEAQFGDMPTITAQHPDAASALRSYVEWRVAADIEVAYPNRDADLITYDRLDKRAQAALATVQTALAVADVSQAAVDPQWAFPLPSPYADQSPASGAEFVIGNNWWVNRTGSGGVV